MFARLFWRNQEPSPIHYRRGKRRKKGTLTFAMAYAKVSSMSAEEKKKKRKKKKEK